METINNTAVNENATAEHEPLRITVEEPVPFNSVGEIKIITTDELGKIVNDLFSQAFTDYYGCKLQVQFQPDHGSYIVVPSMVFQVLNPKQYNNARTAFKPLGAITDTNIVNRVQRLSQISATSGAKVSMTDDGKEALEEFIIAPNKNQHDINWTNYYNSIRTDAGTYIELFKLDINKIIKKIFGSKDKYGSDLFYQITPTYKLNSNNQYRSPDNWVLNILRLNQDNELATANLLGMYVAPKSGINVITATSTSK